MISRFAPPPDRPPGGDFECAPAGTLDCPLCGQPHRPVWLAPRERARCIRCGRTLATGARLGRESALAFAITGLLLALPAFSLPLVTVGKLGNKITGTLFTSVDALWSSGLRVLALWILVCGTLAPLALLAALAGLLSPRLLAASPRFTRALAFLEMWAMPEVQVLAVLVAFTKLGSLVDVTIGPGLWFYSAMAVATLLAWRSFEFAPSRSARASV